MSRQPIRQAPAAGWDDDTHLRMSVLDRLLDDAPDQPKDPITSVTDAHDRLVAGIRRDLEALLNARRPCRSLEASADPLETSPMGFGLRDFAAGAFNAASRREQLRAEIKQAVARFEGRLTKVDVELLTTRLVNGTLQLRITAELIVDEVRLPVGFDTLIDAPTADVDVRPNTDV